MWHSLRRSGGAAGAGQRALLALVCPVVVGARQPVHTGLI